MARALDVGLVVLFAVVCAPYFAVLGAVGGLVNLATAVRAALAGEVRP